MNNLNQNPATSTRSFLRALLFCMLLSSSSLVMAQPTGGLADLNAPDGVGDNTFYFKGSAMGGQTFTIGWPGGAWIGGTNLSEWKISSQQWVSISSLSGPTNGPFSVQDELYYRVQVYPFPDDPNYWNLALGGVAQETIPGVHVGWENYAPDWQLVGDDIVYPFGNVGIGVADPSEALEVAGKVKADALVFSNGGGFHMNDGTWIRTSGNKNFYHNNGILRTDGRFQVGSNGSRFVVNSNGRVGIGVTGPNEKLEVDGTVKATAFSGNGNSITNLQWGNISGAPFSLTSSGASQALFNLEGSTTSTVKLSTTAGNSVQLGGGNDDFALGVTSSDGDPFYFAQKGSYSEASDWVFVTGNVGVGVADPTEKLEIHGATMKLHNPSENSEFIFSGRDKEVRIGVQDDDEQGFYVKTADNAGVQQYRFAVNGVSGNVGIGKEIATEKLDVAGTVKASIFSGDGSSLTNIPWSAITGAPASNSWVDDGSGNVSTSGRVTGERFNITSKDNKLYEFRPANNSSTGVSIRATSNPPNDKNLFTIESSGGSTRLGVTQEFGTWIKDGLIISNTEYENGGLPDLQQNLILDGGKIGVGVTTPSVAVDVAGTVKATNFSGNGASLTNIPWSAITGAPAPSSWTDDGNGNLSTTGNVTGNQFVLPTGAYFAYDQGGSLELGGNNSTSGTGTPFIDFHYNGKTQDYNVRLINYSDGKLKLEGGQFYVPTGEIRAERYKLDLNSTGLNVRGNNRLRLYATNSASPGIDFEVASGNAIEIEADKSIKTFGDIIMSDVHDGEPESVLKLDYIASHNDTDQIRIGWNPETMSDSTDNAAITIGPYSDDADYENHTGSEAGYQQVMINTDEGILGTSLTVGGTVYVKHKNQDEAGSANRFDVDLFGNEALLWVEEGIVTEALTYMYKENWIDDVPDYVFADDYALMKLSDVEEYIKENQHLPGIPSLSEMEENGGVEARSFTFKLLEKIEELTLHTITQQKLIEEQNKTISSMRKLSEEQAEAVMVMKRQLEEISLQIENK